MFLHDNYLHECAREGFYVGYNNYELVLSDGGRAHEIRNAKIYNNRVENSEWDSIQVFKAICYVPQEQTIAHTTIPPIP